MAVLWLLEVKPMTCVERRSGVTLMMTFEMTFSPATCPLTLPLRDGPVSDLQIATYPAKRPTDHRYTAPGY